MDQIVLLSWESAGLRCPDHRVSLERDPSKLSVHPVSLVQMPNGTGKTTTLELLRAAFSGSAETWSESKVRGFQKRSSSSTDGSFRVQFSFQGKRYTIGMQFDFDEGTVRYFTTLPSGQQPGFRPPQVLHSNYFRAGMIDYFIFDGELADNLLDSSKTNAQVALEELFHLSILKRTVQIVNAYWRQSVGDKGLGNKGLQQRKNAVEKISEQLDLALKRQKEVEAQHAAAVDKLETLNKNFEAQLAQSTENQKKLKELTEAAARWQNERKDKLSKLIIASRSPASLAPWISNTLLSLRASFDRAKLPGSSAKEFFQELSAESHCICGRPIDEQSKEAILERSAMYLGTEDVALLNSIKNSIAETVAPEPGKPHDRFTAGIDDYVSVLREELRSTGELEAFEEEVAQQNPELQKLHKQIANLKTDVDRLSTELQVFESADDSRGHEQTWGINVLRARLKNAEKKLAEATHTVRLKGQTELLETMLNGAYEIAKDKISKRLCAETNKILDRVLPLNPIRVKSIEQSLTLMGQQERGSVGETLSVGYAFLSALFQQGGHRLPLVVDSPANPIDLAVRKRVAELVCQISHQFVAFTISSERQYFTDVIEATLPSEVQYLTVFRKPATELEAQAAKESSTVQSSDGVVVSGRDFFEAFHLEEEQ